MSAPADAMRARRGWLAPALIVALCLVAWAALVAFSGGPYARYVDHGRWTDLPLLGAWCAPLARGDAVVAVLFHAAVVALVVAGYALAWSAFGVLAFALDTAVRAIAAHSTWLALNGRWLGAAVLAGAGAFQFSRLKYRCLDRCRAPFGFISERWHGGTPHRDALRIGVDHGVFCVGCCWALMLVMFVVGMSNLAWMLLLAALMAAEKNLPVSRKLATPAGVALLSWAVLLALGIARRCARDFAAPRCLLLSAAVSDRAPDSAGRRRAVLRTVWRAGRRCARVETRKQVPIHATRVRGRTHVFARSWHERFVFFCRNRWQTCIHAEQPNSITLRRVHEREANPLCRHPA